MQVIFLDNGLIGRGEHSYSLLKQVGKSLARRGLRARPFGAKAMDPSVAAELGAVPHFSHSLYSQQRRPLLSRLLRLEWDAARSSERATWRILNKSGSNIPCGPHASGIHISERRPVCVP